MHGDAKPTRRGGSLRLDVSIADAEALNLVLKRALTETQILILSRVIRNSYGITQMLIRISESTGVPLSTLKSSAKTLRELGLIDCAQGMPRATNFGLLLLSLMAGNNVKR